MVMEKTWIKAKPTYFLDQAHELIRLFHIEEKYFSSEESDDCDVQIRDMKEFVKECYPQYLGELIISALDSVRPWINHARLEQTLRAPMSRSRWKEVIESYQQDHHLLYTAGVKPDLP